MSSTRIPKIQIDQAEVDAMVQAHEDAKQTLAEVTDQEEKAVKRADELADNAVEAAAIAYEQKNPQLYDDALAEAEAAAKEVKRLRAVKAGQARRVTKTGAALALINRQAHVGRVSGIAERLVRSAIRLEKGYEQTTAEWRKFCGLVDDLRLSYPGGPPPEAAELDCSEAMWKGLCRTIYRLSAVPDRQNKVGPGPSMLPGAHPVDDRFYGLPDKLELLSDQVTRNMAWLLSVLRGEIDGRTGQPIGQASEPSEPATDEKASEAEMLALLNPPDGPKISAIQVMASRGGPRRMG